MKKILVFLFGFVFLLNAAGCQSNNSTQRNNISENRTEKNPEIDWDVNTSTATVTMDGWEYFLVRDNAKKTVRIPKVQYVGNEDAEELHIVIPSIIDGMRVTAVGQSDKDKDESEEFYNSLFGEVVEEPHGLMKVNEITGKITEITLPEKLETIEHGALAGLPGLREITLPNTLSQMGELVFYCCDNLERVVISKNLASFPPDIFEECHTLSEIQVSEDNSKLYEQDGFIITRDSNQLIYAIPAKEKMDIPQGVKSLGERALQYSLAKTIWIPASVIHIEKQALSASGVESIDVDENNPFFAKDGHCLYRKEDNGLVAVECANGRLEVSQKVQRIDENAMSAGVNQKVKRVIIGKNVKMLAGDWMNCFTQPLDYGTSKYEFRGATPPRITDRHIGSGTIPKYCTIYVPSGAVNDYRKWVKRHGGWHTKIKCF